MMTPDSSFASALVTGSTGLLGNNLVRLLLSRGVKVKALARSRKKAEQQFPGLAVEMIEGDMNNVAAFAQHLRGVDVIFHTAAYFRDNYKGGKHWKELYDTNVTGTVELLTHAHQAGVRRFVHTSSVAVVTGAPGQLIDETMLRTAEDADDYQLSKILSDRAILSFLEKHSDMHACMVLPGWMIGPGDIGPTSSGQVILDFLHRKLQGVPRATFSVVDARDVAEALRLAALHGRSGERYLAAGRHMAMTELAAELEQLTGVPAPRRQIAPLVLLGLGAATELWAHVTGKPALIGLARVRLMRRELNRSHFSDVKSKHELGLLFRPVEDTLRDTIDWYIEHGWVEKSALANGRVPKLHFSGENPAPKAP